MTTKKLLIKINKSKGDSNYSYLKNKHKGGTNNSKGNNFENYFTVYKIAKNFNAKVPAKTTFTSQDFAFIDDLVINIPSKKEIKCFQIKDVTSLSWNGGPHSLKDDFILQNKVYKRRKLRSSLNLIVSKKQLAEQLNATKPISIRKYVNVIHFESADSINNLLRQNNLLKKELIRMCAIQHPTIDKLETLGTIILGAWDATNKHRIKLRDLINRCDSINPNYIRGRVNEISDNLRVLLNSIPDFRYKITNGIIAWTYLNTDKGDIQYKIGTPDFNRWEANLLGTIINNFDELEPFLSA